MMDLESIWSNHKPSNNNIITKTRLEFIPQFICYAATNHFTGNHLFLIELSSTIAIPKSLKFKFKGVRIEVFELKNNQELNIYLLDNGLKDIFSSFVENILEEISNVNTEEDALRITSNIIQKWKKLFDKLNSEGLSLEQQKGLLGELILFKEFLNNGFSPSFILESWTGPEYEDKDYAFGSQCFEVKLSTSKLPRIKITSERQLDTSNIDNLYLSFISAEIIKENGITLNSIIMSIREILSNCNINLQDFNDKLELVGYFNEDNDSYHTQYGIKTWSNYLVAHNFPRLISLNIPQGVYDTSYYIETGVIEQYKLDLNLILKTLK